jgi:hypothetical protein
VCFFVFCLFFEVLVFLYVFSCLFVLFRVFFCVFLCFSVFAVFFFVFVYFLMFFCHLVRFSSRGGLVILFFLNGLLISLVDKVDAVE